MTAIPDSYRDLLSAQVATLATVGSDGRPQLSEVWFLAEGDTMSISLNSIRQKMKNLLRNSTVPTAVAVFTTDVPIRPFAHKLHHVVRWTEFTRGRSLRRARSPRPAHRRPAGVPPEPDLNTAA